jgi:hypothetical protein
MRLSSSRRSYLLLAFGLALSACAQVDTVRGAAEPATIGTGGTNSAPQISGQPSGSAVAGSTYVFTPTAADAEGSTLAFSISGKPSWATFSTVTGTLNGTPASAQLGTYAGIVITASDGSLSTSLPAFSIVVTASAPPPPPAAGVASLSWVAPTQNTDGTTLTDLAGFRVYHGFSAESLSPEHDLPGAGVSTYRYEGLSSGTHYFAVSAYAATGVESALSNVGSKTIP